MIQIDTNTQSEAEVRDVFAAHGLEGRVVEPVKKPEQPKVAEKPTKPAGEPGEKVPAETAGGATATEGEETPTQEATPAPTQTTEDHPEKKKSKGGFQAKNEKLTKLVNQQAEKISELELLLEGGSSKRLSQELAEAKEELARLQGGGGAKPEAKETGPVRPKRPSMPDLVELDYDQDKFNAAMKQYRADMDKYDEEMDAYLAAQSTKAAQEAVAAKEAKDREAQVNEANQKALNAFVERRDRDVAELGKEELLADIDAAEKDGSWAWPETLQLPILQSEIPGRLMIFLYENPDELERISGYVDHLGNPNPVRMLRELGKIEDKLMAEVSAKQNGAGAKPEAVAPAKPEAAPVAPAKQKQRAETPEAPIKPVGTRSAAGEAKSYWDLANEARERGDMKEYQRLRVLEHQEKAKANAR